MNNKQLFALLAGGVSFLAGATAMLIPRRTQSQQDIWLGDTYVPNYILEKLKDHNCEESDNSFSTSVGKVTADKLLKAFNSCSDETFIFSHNGVEIRVLTDNKDFIVADMIVKTDITYKNPLEVASLAVEFQGKLLEVVAAGFKYEYIPLSLASPESFGTLQLFVSHRGDVDGFKKFLELAVKLMSE